jgi:hypothetical protein
MPEPKNDEAPKPDYFLGLDLGQAQDFTAMAVLEQTRVEKSIGVGTTRPPVWFTYYALRHLKRWPLGTSYPAIVEEVKQLVQEPPLDHPCLAVDQTGVGRAVVDMFRQAQLVARLQPIVITSGHAVTAGERGTRNVPKKELASVLQVLLQSRRLKIARQLEHAATLQKELTAFRVKITAAANETFEAWRERDHDDLVLAVALAAWLAERGQRRLWVL